VVNVIRELGFKPIVTDNPDDLKNAKAVILPGVGAAADTMKGLEETKMAGAVRWLVEEGKPLFAVCVGLQVLLSTTEEGGWHECLGLVDGVVKKLPDGAKIPHIGWNQVAQKENHWIFKGIPDGTDFYFVHSYYAKPEDESVIIGTTDYGNRWCSILARDNLIATQFHPEKSGSCGLKMYDNFLKRALG
jgi:glutamine amidotransferase